MASILIRNKGELPLWGVRLLGLSDKGGDKIGQFGTGLKETLALLARYDRLPVIYSGLNRIEFSVQTIEGQAEICFRQSVGSERFASDCWHGMGLHPNYGKADWVDAWMALREVICNGQDAGELHHDVCSLDPYGSEGCTNVFIPLNQAILEAYSLIEKRLLFLRPRETVQEAGSRGRAMRKMEDGKLQVFHKGVWIQAAKKDSLYDYELHSIRLNESRSCDWWSVDWEIAMIVAEYTLDQTTEVLRRVIERRDTSFYEHGMFDRASDHIELGDNNWLRAFVNVYGTEAVVTGTDAHFYERLKAAGYVPVVVADDSLHKLLLAAGCKNATGTLSHAEKEFGEVITPTIESQRVFDQVWDRLVELRVTGDKKKPALMLFRQRPNETELRLGCYDHGVCYVNKEVVGSEQEVLACVEEIAHHVSGAYDNSRQFQTYLVQVASRCIGVSRG